MNPVQTYDPYDGRMITREERIGGYVKLADYEALEKRVKALEKAAETTTQEVVVPETTYAGDAKD
jgi:hypothetical protein